MSDSYADAKFAFIDDEGDIRLVQAKSMTFAKANKGEQSRVFKQLLAGERKIFNVVSCRHWSGKFND